MIPPQATNPAAIPIPVWNAWTDADLTAANSKQRVARIALLEQDLAHRQMLRVAKARNPLQFVGT